MQPLTSCVTLGKLLSLSRMDDDHRAGAASWTPLWLNCGKMALSQWKMARAAEAMEVHSGSGQCYLLTVMEVFQYLYHQFGVLVHTSYTS